MFVFISVNVTMCMYAVKFVYNKWHGNVWISTIYINQTFFPVTF